MEHVREANMKEAECLITQFGRKFEDLYGKDSQSLPNRSTG